MCCVIASYDANIKQAKVRNWPINEAADSTMKTFDLRCKKVWKTVWIMFNDDGDDDDNSDSGMKIEVSEKMMKADDRVLVRLTVIWQTKGKSERQTEIDTF